MEQLIEENAFILRQMIPFLPSKYKILVKETLDKNNKYLQDREDSIIKQAREHEMDDNYGR